MGRIQYVIATSVIALGCTFFTTSCLQDPVAAEAEPGSVQRSDSPEPIGEAQQETGRKYRSSDFPFVVDVRDDEKGKGGGWQVSDRELHFFEQLAGFPVYFWTCRIRIGIPIRNAAEGRIPPDLAAQYSAEVANAVVDPLLDSQSTWIAQGASFCIKLQAGMQMTFRQLHAMLGARVELNP